MPYLINNYYEFNLHLAKAYKNHYVFFLAHLQIEGILPHLLFIKKKQARGIISGTAGIAMSPQQMEVVSERSKVVRPQI